MATDDSNAAAAASGGQPTKSHGLLSSSRWARRERTRDLPRLTMRFNASVGLPRRTVFHVHGRWRLRADQLALRGVSAPVRDRPGIAKAKNLRPVAIPAYEGPWPKLTGMNTTRSSPLHDPTAGIADPVAACENVLHAVRARYVDSNVWPSLVTIIDRLLARRLELVDAYGELRQALPDWRALDMLFDAVMVTAAFHNPERINGTRQVRAELEATNGLIANLGHQLTEQLRRRSELCERSAFSTSAHSHVVDVIEEASGSNSLFKGYLREHLDELRYRFDFKYWPSLASCVAVIAEDAHRATVHAVDSLTEASTASPHRGRVPDFFKALFQAIGDRSTKRGCFLPDGYLPSDRTLASLGSCALALPADELVDATQVKSIRQRLRRRAAKQESL